MLAKKISWNARRNNERSVIESPQFYSQRARSLHSMVKVSKRKRIYISQYNHHKLEYCHNYRHMFTIRRLLYLNERGVLTLRTGAVRMQRSVSHPCNKFSTQQRRSSSFLKNTLVFEKKDRKMVSILYNLKIDIVTISFVDAGFATNDDLSTKLGFMMSIIDGNNPKNIIHCGSLKFKRVTRSVLAAELIAFLHGFDVASTIRL